MNTQFNATFAEQDETFNLSCLIMGIKNTKAQARKYRNNRGLAFAVKDLLGSNINKYKDFVNLIKVSGEPCEEIISLRISVKNFIKR